MVVKVRIDLTNLPLNVPHPADEVQSFIDENETLEVDFIPDFPYGNVNMRGRIFVYPIR
jgi:hypothetical protein